MAVEWLMSKVAGGIEPNLLSGRAQVLQSRNISTQNCRDMQDPRTKQIQLLDKMSKLNLQGPLLFKNAMPMGKGTWFESRPPKRKRVSNATRKKTWVI